MQLVEVEQAGEIGEHLVPDPEPHLGLEGGGEGWRGHREAGLDGLEMLQSSLQRGTAAKFSAEMM